MPWCRTIILTHAVCACVTGGGDVAQSMVQPSGRAMTATKLMHLLETGLVEL